MVAQKPSWIRPRVAPTLSAVILFPLPRLLCIAALVLMAGRLGAAPDPLAARVIVVANSRAPESVALAQFYASERGIPKANVLSVPMSTDETISWREFINEVYRPLQKELLRRGWLDGSVTRLNDRLGRDRYALTGHHISYLVTCRGVPLRIKNDSSLLDEPTGLRIGRALFKDEAAVDSELSLLAQSGYEITGTLPNPFFNEDNVSAVAAGTAIKVTRLDGPTDESARHLVTAAIAAERTGLLGRAYVDLQGPHADGDKWLQSCLTLLEESGFDGEVERSGATFDLASRFDAPALYFGWYANDLNGPFAREGFRFPDGAVALHIHSYSARTLRSDRAGWTGPLVARGVTATVGNVYEPYLQLTHRPDLLLQALLQGKNFGDAAAFALPVLSWQSFALGDPLYRPFKVDLDQQEKQLDQLPPDRAKYVLIRRSNLLQRAGRTAEAWNILQQDLRASPSLVMALACAKFALSTNSRPAAVATLETIPTNVPYSVEEWSLARQAAATLAICEARESALRVYDQVAQSPAPSPAAQRAVLTDALAVAKAAGDAPRTEKFERLLTATGAKP